ncbi:hypothetical protein HK103_006168 [Boothiomyces macroporosus]|uniref:Coiled-coil domain-containing protein 146 n=1 Tax=Boothiomyces macroporosus TaxID=261099 RepID=A0AAD5UIA3_9FUNG|nr:hypothetical protein HK103_006168 [Boothiomyces macroporosus]
MAETAEEDAKLKDSKAPETQVLDIDDEDHQGDYYLSGLFNIESSPGYKALDALKTKKDVTEERINKYKKAFIDLHGFLLSLTAFEKEMSETFRNTLQDMTMQRLEKDRAISLQFTGNAEIGDLKRELLKAQNEVDMAIDRESKLQLDIEELSKTKQDLIHDIEEIRRHKADMLEPQLIAATKELKIDLLQRRQQVENLQKDMEEKQAAYEIVMQERSRAEAEREKHSIAFVKASETPIKILKQIEVLRDAMNSLTAENLKQQTISSSLDKEIERLGKKKKDLEEMRIGLSAAYEERRGLIIQMERQVDDIFKEHELAKEQLAFQRAERVRLDLSLRKHVYDIKREHDLVLRVIREKDTFLKLYRRLELTVNNIKLSTPATIKHGIDLQRQLEAIRNDEKHYKKEVQRLRQAIDVSTYEFLQQDRVEKAESEELEEQFMVNKKLEAELDTAIKEASLVARAVEEIKLEKDLRSREVIRAQVRIRSLKNDNATQDIALVDAAKRCNETVTRVKEFMALYELVKNERNKYRRRQENSAAYALRDSLRNEANKLMLQYRDKRDQIEHRLTRIEALNSNINAAEEEMQVLKARYEQSVKDRNMAGVHLLDRNDELCILYERINVKKEIMSKGAAALADRNDEIRKLQLILAESKRQLELQKQKKPIIAELDKEIAKLDKKKTELMELTLTLGGQMENPSDENRCRNLGGVDPTQEELTKKIEKLENLLSIQEESILEKDLILEEVSALVERLKMQTVDSKDETHTTTTEINELTKRIKNITKKTMAKVSELAMHQAMAMSLYRETSEKECLLDEAKSRLESGDIPLDQIEGDFIREERKRQQRKAKLQALKEKRERIANGRFIELEDDFYLHGKVKTTAEPRPNAYIPETTGLGQLPIPKPYGEHSPFKPQEPGAQLRHYKKPSVQSIEI